MADAEVKWDEDALEYGYVLDRPAPGSWWQLHFGRSSRSYHCALLADRATILASIQRFAVGAVASSPRFLLTLDGRPVELSDEEPVIDYRWGRSAAGVDLADEARRFQRDVMPRLAASPSFQQAIAGILAAQDSGASFPPES